MADKCYAFVDSRCPVCNGSGLVQVTPNCRGVKSCDYCHGTGLVGEYKEVPQIDYHGPCALAWRLRKTREARHVGMDVLSKLFGMSVVRLSDIERGRGEKMTSSERTMITNWIYGGKNESNAVSTDGRQN